ncbi:hypothetical protein EYF80_039964 [Liparis tanakae]|uniref:Uncharacterized protein n=1 Tax=Liparis tanakae TaxID=230148 RepID=A0A4Z2G9D2_9TELE|nr:hypothetical protein EYF80_039964 [Liparis tanakae]
MWKFKAFCLDYWHVLCLHPHSNFYKSFRSSRNIPVILGRVTGRHIALGSKWDFESVLLKNNLQKRGQQRIALPITIGEQQQMSETLHWTEQKKRKEKREGGVCGERTGVSGLWVESLLL